jgi:STE24 endopeptidase
MTVLKALSAAFIALFFCTALALAQPPGANEMPSVVVVPAAAQPSDHFDATAATDAYMAQISPERIERSNNYFEGGYWLILWDFLYGAVISLLLLGTRWSAKMRNLAERSARYKPIQSFIYWVQYLIISSVLGFPLAVYEGYFREHKYGMATQTFGPWFVDQLKGLAIGVVLGGILVMLLFGVVRRFPRGWPVLGAGVSYAFIILVVFIAPVFLVPIFNKVTPLNDPKIVDPILRLARQNGIPAKNVYTIDASRQTTQMSANVSGFGNTMRITLNDNLLRRGSPEEIQAVMGHEMGHYVMNHIYKGLTFFLIVVLVFWMYLWGTIGWALKHWGEKWQIRGIGDTAIVPLVILLGSVFFFVMTPINNSYTRTQEYEADMYGLNTSRQPDGFAQAAIHLGEYRKMNPGPVEEWVFFDHPSGRNRIFAAMRWKAENLSLFTTQTATAPAAGQTTSQPAEANSSKQ